MPRYFDAAFWEALDFYASTVLLAEFGAQPFSGGWTRWPERAVKILLVLKAEASRCDEEERKAHSGER